MAALPSLGLNGPANTSRSIHRELTICTCTSSLTDTRSTWYTGGGGGGGSSLTWTSRPCLISSVSLFLPSLFCQQNHLTIWCFIYCTSGWTEFPAATLTLRPWWLTSCSSVLKVSCRSQIEYRVSSKTVCTCSLFVNCASHAGPIIKWSIYFFLWIKIDAKNGITLKN